MARAMQGLFASAMPSLLSTRQKNPETANPVMLAQAFEVFSSAADSLQHSYGILQGEVSRLRRELELRNRDLADSIAENERMRARLGHILENLPCGVLVVGSPVELRYANDVARRLLASAAASDRSAEPIPGSLAHILARLDFPDTGEEDVWVIDGQTDSTTISISCAPIPGSRERVVILRDITEERRIQEEIEFSRRMKALAGITALLAHEIRNPLGSLELFADLVRDATKDEHDVSEWVVHLQAGLRALSATVNNVLNFYTDTPPATAPLDLVKLLTRTMEFLQPLALQRGMAIRWKTTESEAFIQADEYRLQQVFFNIAINAFRAMTAGGILTIGLAKESRDGRPAVRVDFEDQGVGIPPKHLARIFEAGFSTRQSSPGLGLAVCRRVMDQHGGLLEVKSIVGQGTIFSLSFAVVGVEQ